MSFAAMLRKDLRRELRGKAGLQAGLVVALLLLAVDLFAFRDAALPSMVAAAVLWTPLAYAGIAAAGRGIAAEADAGTLDRLRLAPVDPVWIGLSRTVADLATGLVVTFVAAVAASLLFALPFTPALASILALGALGIGLVGSLAGALAAQTRGRDILLPLLAIPLLAPLVQAGTSATVAVLEGATWDAILPRVAAIAGYDLAALAAAWILWPVLLEADA